MGGLLLIGAGGFRIHHARTMSQQAAQQAEHCLDAHAAVSVLERQIGTLPPTEKKAFLRKAINDDNHAWRYAAIDPLAAEGSPEALDLVEQAFNDNYSETRKRAVEVLFSIPGGEDRGLLLLLTALRDTDSWVREAAISQLQLYSTRGAGKQDRRLLPGLIQALDDNDIAVSTIATSVLKRLTGKPWRISAKSTEQEQKVAIKQWKAWWQGEIADARKSIPAKYWDVPARVPTRTDPLPNFYEKDLDGNAFHTSDRKGKITLINFWGRTCPPCRAELPDLVRVADTYKDRNVEVIGVDFGDTDAAKLRKWCEEHGLRYRQSLGENGIKQVFGDIEDVPITFLIGPDGRIHDIWDGERDFETFKAGIDRLLK